VDVFNILIKLCNALDMIYEFWWHDYEVMIGNGLWVFKYVYEIRNRIWFDNVSKNDYEIENWKVFYDLYDEFKSCDMLKWSWWECDVKVMHMCMISWSWWEKYNGLLIYECVINCVTKSLNAELKEDI
jgi:hypothetical protein